MTDQLSLGHRIKLTQGTATKYFIVVAIGDYDEGTTDVIVYGGTDYDVADSSTSPITDVYFSGMKIPFGFPYIMSKWTEEFVDTTGLTQSNPAVSTWYNAFSFTLPRGAWHLFVRFTMGANHSSTSFLACFGTISTANNSESDANTTQYVYVNSTNIRGLYQIEDFLLLDDEDTLYFNVRRGSVAIDEIRVVSSLAPGVVRAVCAYF
jgi:hypothetical protein